MLKGQLWLMALVLLAFLLGCTAASKINGIHVGMTKQEAVAVMGEPNSTSAKGDVEYLNYRLTRGPFLVDDYYIRIQDGKVDAFGRAGDFGLGY